MKKLCSKCYHYERMTDRTVCNGCHNKWMKDYYTNNKAKRKDYYQDNKEDKKKYCQNNKDHKKEYDKNYYKDNFSNRKEYIKNNKEKINKRDNDRRKNNPIYNLRTIMSKSIGAALKRNGSSKNRNSCIKFLPYTIEELRRHIESLFEPWMSWNNWGTYNSKSWNDNDKTTWAWQIDHIIPHSTFEYVSMEDDEFKKCWALENLRPYSARQNVLDGTSKIRHKL